MSAFNIGVDIGGTFTDCVLHDVAGNRIVTAKAPSLRHDLAGSVLSAVRAASERLGVPLEDVLGGTERFIHGSTVATNAMIERNGARTALPHDRRATRTRSRSARSSRSAPACRSARCPISTGSRWPIRR